MHLMEKLYISDIKDEENNKNSLFGAIKACNLN
jgi:hypothetical protein